MKEKAAKVDLFEKEILKYKERLNELEFYKARTAELKEDNSILEETKAMLEDQLTNSRKRIETVVELETELARNRAQLDTVTRTHDSDLEKIEYLTELNARLEFEKKSSMCESASLETELSAARSRIGNMASSLSDQLSETSHAKILRLELENQRLSAKLAEMKETALIQSAEMSLEMEKENKRLSNKIEKLQTSMIESSERVIKMENDLTASKDEREKLLKVLETVKENCERQVRELERENEQLSQALCKLQERSEQTSDVKVKDLERENKRLHEVVTTKNSQLSKLEFDYRQLHRSGQQLQEGTQRLKELEVENQSLEKENVELHQKVATLQHLEEKVDLIEQENSDLGVENRKLQKMVETLQVTTQRREQLEQDHISLTLEHQRLQRTLESFKSESDRALELEAEKEELNRELQQLRKSLEGQKTQKLRQEQMEFDLIDTGNENQRLLKSLEVTTRRLQTLEKDNMDMETENERLTKEIEALKVTSKKLEDKEKEASQLEVEVQRLQKDKTTLEKENRKLKQSGEFKDSTMEEMNVKFTSLEQENKTLKKTVDKMKDTCNKVKDLEKENNELLHDLNTDRRTLAALREDLIHEKIHSQELSNELDQLTTELEKVGINTDKLTMVEQTNDANRYKALETMIEETLKKSSELKDEKIRALEIRLDESKNRNLKLQDDLRSTKMETETLKQRLEEELDEKDGVDGRVVESYVKSSNPTKEIFQLKDHLVELERSNARLMAEAENLRSNNTGLGEHCRKMENQLSNLQSQHATLQGYYSSLQEQNAKLQVEYSTLQSQASSTLSQQDILKSQMSRLESDYEILAHKHEGLQSTHQSLISDHESLQHLHQQLTSEYESLVSEHGSLKSIHKSLKSEYKALSEQCDAVMQGKDDVNKLREMMEKERDKLQRELLAVGNLQSDYNRLRDDHQQQRAAYDKLSHDYSDVLGSHKQIKTDYNNLQLKNTELQGELNEAKENMSVADMEFQKLENRMDTIYQINERIENENQALLMQIQQLLNQNHDLLTKALNSKDHFAEEEKAYLEKLSELRRQKERLEEKIMEHYKNRISPKKKGLGALIARKARGIISRGPRRSKSRNNLSDMTDTSGHESDQPSDAGRRLDDIISLLSLSSASTIGAKSTEDLNDSNNTDYSFLPGLGRPYVLDDSDPISRRSTTPGLGRRLPGSASPGSEMLTLDQFLKEANSSDIGNMTATNRATDEQRHKDFIQRQRSHDSESRSSDNSNSSFSKVQLRHSQGRGGVSQFRPDVPDVAVSTLAPYSSSRELNSSLLSRLSAGSGNEDSSFNSNGPLPCDVFSSTPKTKPELDGFSVIASGNLNGNNSSVQHGGERSNDDISRKSLSGDDWQNSSLKSSPYSTFGRLNNVSSSSSPRLSGSHSSSSSSSKQPPPSNHSSSHPSNHIQVSDQPRALTNRVRELPPVPTEQMAAVERLDRLARRDQSPSHYAQPVTTGKLSMDNDRSRDNHPISREAERNIVNSERRRSQETPERPHWSSNQVPPPIPRSHPGRVSNSQQQNLDNSVISGHHPPSNPILMQAGPQLRTRPASAMGPGPIIKGVYSRPQGEGRPRQQQQGVAPSQLVRRDTSGGRSQGDHSSSSHYSQPHVTERPKSVPPQLFNKTDSPVARDGRDTKNRDMIREAPDGGRDIKDPIYQPVSNVSLLREPSRSSSRLGTPLDSQLSRPVPMQQPSPSAQSFQPKISHQQNYAGQVSFNGSRQNLPAPQQAISQSEPGRLSKNLVSLYDSNNIPPGYKSSTLGHQSSSPRPDALPLAPGQPQNRSSFNSGMNSPLAGASSTVFQAQSSIGSPTISSPSSTLPPDATYGRNVASHQSRYDTQPDQIRRDGHQRDAHFTGSGHPPGTIPATHQGSGSHDSMVDSRLYRTSSESRDNLSLPQHRGYMPPQSQQRGSDGYLPPQSQQRGSDGYLPPQSQQRGSDGYLPPQSQHRGSDDSYYSNSQSPNPPLLGRSISQGQFPLSQRTPVGPSKPDHLANGPPAPSKDPLHFNSHHQSVSPQIRSQSKPPTSIHHNNVSSTSRQMSAPSTLRSTGDLSTPDRNLSPPETTTTQVTPPQLKSTTNAPQKSEKEGEGGQPNHTNSIWYEYGCV
ncbi:unnamed protein product [Lymnaea stagnalis]|uniref:Girdin n=1 Tax=Lymnaea stagnalis TaxID=6523 RepID=A0AAV2H9R5_LYMST